MASNYNIPGDDRNWTYTIILTDMAEYFFAGVAPRAGPDNLLIVSLCVCLVLDNFTASDWSSYVVSCQTS